MQREIVEAGNATLCFFQRGASRPGQTPLELLRSEAFAHERTALHSVQVLGKQQAARIGVLLMDRKARVGKYLNRGHVCLNTPSHHGLHIGGGAQMVFYHRQGFGGQAFAPKFGTESEAHFTRPGSEFAGFEQECSSQFPTAEGEGDAFVLDKGIFPYRFTHHHQRIITPLQCSTPTKTHGVRV